MKNKQLIEDAKKLDSLTNSEIEQLIEIRTSEYGSNYWFELLIKYKDLRICDLTAKNTATSDRIVKTIETLGE